ncbi:MAG: hypothetical protein PHT04_05320 [Eubacteriales bacterium]|nr:hypothetical protein [Eubacteriales bacterium]
MVWIFGTIAILLAAVIIWFSLSYSPVQSEFHRMVAAQISQIDAGIDRSELTEADIAHLPEPVQKHLRWCGYVGAAKMSHMKAHYDDVNFNLSGRTLKIKYTQYNFAQEPVRIAYIDTHLFGVPFEGLDSYYGGEGAMKGVLGKAITLFNEKGPAMDQSCLATSLAEVLLLPTLALQDFIEWETMDDHHVRATLSYDGISASGVFTFGEQGEMIQFTTSDREYTEPNGMSKPADWSAVCGQYREANGIKTPTSLQAVWHLETGDLVYFDGRDIAVTYDVTE